MKLGVIARAEDRGLGNQTWEVTRNLDPERVLVVRVRGSERQGFPAHLDRYPGATVVTVDERNWTLPEPEIRDWLDELDVVYSAETLYDWRLADWAREQRVATVVHCNPEFYGHHRADIAHPSTWWAPTLWRINTLPVGARVVPQPVPLDRFVEPDYDDIPRRVLHVAGRAATGDRNGTNVVLGALRYLPDDIEVVVATQTPVRRPQRRPGAAVSTVPAAANYWSIYDGFPILALPRRYGGLCLPANEACAAGLVPVMPAVEPNGHWPITVTPHHPGHAVRLPNGAVSAADVTPKALAATICDLFDHQDLAKLRREARAWAERHSWAALAPVWHKELEAAVEQVRRPRPRRKVTATIVVPFTPGVDQHRDEAWAWLHQRLVAAHPDWPIIEATTGEPWSKGRAVAAVIDQVDTDVLIVHDADSFIDRSTLAQAVERIGAGAPWVMPHTDVHRLNRDQTRRVLTGPPDIDTIPEALDRRRLARRPYAGIVGGGIVVLPRAGWDIAPLDPRFEGWGLEDIAWGHALDTLLGAHVRLGARLFHLWHPPQPNHLNPPVLSQALEASYRAAQGIPRRMAALVSGEDPEPLPPPAEPVRFRSTRHRWLRIGGHKLRFDSGEVVVTDPDLVEALRHTRDVEEV